MNRFLPDTWFEAFFRPIAMAFPDGWIYLEIIAPDFRFLFLIALAAIAAVSNLYGYRQPAVLWSLALLIAIAFVPWLLTTGNGRYFIPIFILSGVLCIAFIKTLPFTRVFRVSLATLLLVVQGLAVSQNSPWQSTNPWSFVDWKAAPYFDLWLDAEATDEPATYVTLSIISYSLVAPLFPPASRWINLSALQGYPSDAPDMERAHNFIASAHKLQLFVPAFPGGSTARGLPTDATILVINQLLRQNQLAISESPEACRFLPSKTISSSNEINSATNISSSITYGFWVCALKREISISYELEHADAQLMLDGRNVFRVIEKHCPRFFPAGLVGVTPIPEGVMRHYQAADMKIYVFKDRNVYYKYFRALNPVLLGSVEEILKEGYTMSCHKIRGRSGLPWEREI